MVSPRYGFSALTGDFDGDGWPDIYVATDTSPSILLRNLGNGPYEEIGHESGTAVNEHGNEQGRIGGAASDFNRDGLLDIGKTNFDNDTPSLYVNLGDGLCSEEAMRSGLGVNTHLVGWGSAFVNLDNDGWQDLFMVNGHVYRSGDRFQFKQARNLYWNLREGRFAEILAVAGEGAAQRTAARAEAFGDLGNDGRIDFVVNNLNGPPSLLHNELPQGNWLRIR